MIEQLKIPVPALRRDLSRMRKDRGPGASPGQALRIGNFPATYSRHGPLGLYNGIKTRRRYLHRSLKAFTRQGGATSGRTFATHLKIQYQNARLVRSARRIRAFFEAGTPTKEMASELEKPADSARQSSMERFNARDTIRHYTIRHPQMIPAQCRRRIFSNQQWSL